MATVTSESRAKIRTSMGDMVLEFLFEKAPKTVDNFVTLANKGFYDGLTFHRIVKDFIVQGGCPQGNGRGGPGYTLRPEFNDTPHVKGTVSMARSNDPHSAGSQFFICHGDARYLDSRYTAFARVLEGLDVLDKIASTPTDIDNRFKEKSVPRDPVYINGIDLTGVEFPEKVAPEPQAAPKSDEPEEGRSDESEGRRSGKGGRGRSRGGRGQGESKDAKDAKGSQAAESADEAEKASVAEEPAAEEPAKPARKRTTKAARSKAAAESDEPSPKPKRTRKKTTRAKKDTKSSAKDKE